MRLWCDVRCDEAACLCSVGEDEPAAAAQQRGPLHPGHQRPAQSFPLLLPQLHRTDASAAGHASAAALGTARQLHVCPPAAPVTCVLLCVQSNMHLDLVTRSSVQHVDTRQQSIRSSDYFVAESFSAIFFINHPFLVLKCQKNCKNLSRQSMTE